MKYEKPVVARASAIKAIQGTQGMTKLLGYHPDQINPFLTPTAGAYEADE